MMYVYILESLFVPSQLYIGASSDFVARLNEHNKGKCAHTKKYKPWKLVYYEEFETREDAFCRERQIKKWSRNKKEALIAGDGTTLKELSKRKNKDM